MAQQDYHVSITVDAAAEQAFDAINNVPGWWTTVFEGASEKVDDVFTVRFGETYITIRVTGLVPGSRIDWHVIDCNKHWLQNKKEWKDTTMIWTISEQGKATKIDFTHIGLVPGIECYNGCEGAWNSYIRQSLYKLLTEGKGTPELK